MLVGFAQKVKIPPTVVGGFLQLLSTEHVPGRAVIPTHGSGWIFQIVSKKGLERSTHCRGWDSEIVISKFK